MKTIEKRLSSIFEQKLNLAVPARDTDLFESGALDSLSFVDLLYHMEAEFDVAVPLDELEIENFQSIERIAAFIEEHDVPGSVLQAQGNGRVVKLR